MSVRRPDLGNLSDSEKVADKLTLCCVIGISTKEEALAAWNEAFEFAMIDALIYVKDGQPWIGGAKMDVATRFMSEVRSIKRDKYEYEVGRVADIVESYREVAKAGA